MRWAVAALGLLAACGGPAPMEPGNAVEGAIHSEPLGAVYPVAARHPGTGSDAELRVSLTTDAAYACSELFASPPRSARALVFSLITTTAKVPAVASATGTYQVAAAAGPDGNFAVVEYQEADSTCAPRKEQAAAGVSGTVTVSRLSATSASVAGNFDLVLQTGDHVTGAFESTLCASSDAGGSSCQ